jgi:hypothetical protein
LGDEARARTYGSLEIHWKHRTEDASIERVIAMNEAKDAPALPDRLSIEPGSPYHVAAVFEHEIGIRLNDKERFDVEEYCISEGWVKVPAARTVDRKGRPVMIKLRGKVEVFYR